MVRILPRSRSRSLRVLLIWILLELIAGGQVRSRSGTALGSWLHAVVSPVITAGRVLVHGVQNLSWGFGNTWNLVSENTRLREALAAQRARTLVLENSLHIQNEADHLVVHYPGFVTHGRIETCLVRNLDNGLMKISGGWSDGIHRDAPILAGLGVAGRVIRSGPHSSWVELLTRATAAVAVEIKDSGIPALAAGTGTSSLRIEYIPRRAHVLKAMVLTTSGADGIYPPGLPVARITKVREGNGPFLEVRATPLADLGRIHVCLVLVDWPQRRPGERMP